MTGSPPRARGRQASFRVTPGTSGLTPACAGTSMIRTRRGRGVRAHPRVRGDVFDWLWHSVIEPGLTPACAGTSWVAHWRKWGSRAHPRVRGDVPVLMIPPTAVQGSPPRARGRHLGAKNASGGSGLTPACAGTSPGDARLRLADGAHPRVRGDVRCEPVQVGGVEGSPPRARGRLPAVSSAASARGLTPACAGTSCAPSCRHPEPRAHPRVRGDVWPYVASQLELLGSPPRARGRHRLAVPRLRG